MGRVDRIGFLLVGLLYFGALFAFLPSSDFNYSTNSKDAISIGGKFDTAALSESTSTVVAVETCSAGKNNSSFPDLKFDLREKVCADQHSRKEKFYRFSFFLFKLKFAKTDIAQPFSTFT